jgi:hypothetical protein
MNLIRKAGICVLIASLAGGVSGATWAQDATQFDGFGDINCEDEMARLDGFVVTLQSAPGNKGVIIFYGGRLFRGRSPKRGEAAARAARIKSYLVQRRGLPIDRLTIIDGGFMEKWSAELWVVPPGASMPAPRPTIPVGKIKFRTGKLKPRDYACQI